MVFNRETIEKFWKEREDKLDECEDPCHYMDYWQDRYTREVRKSAIRKLSDVFSSAHTKLIVDIGCGTGTFTSYLAKKTSGKVIGIDRALFVELAKKRQFSKPVHFMEGLIPSPIVEVMVKAADIVTMFTVYDCLSFEDRRSFLEYLSNMTIGSKLILLEYFMHEKDLPDYHKGLSYKHIESRQQKITDLAAIGFAVEKEISVNRIDSKVFYYLGQNALAYYLTKVLDFIPFIKTKYSLIMFNKVK